MFKEVVVGLAFRTSTTLILRPKTIVVFQAPCQKKTGSVGRLYFFFTFFLLTVQNSSFPSSPPKMYRQCHQAVDPGDMNYCISFINIGKSRGPRTLPKGHPLTRLHQVLIISDPIIIGVYAVGGGGGFCQRPSAVSHNTVSFESMSML